LAEIVAGFGVPHTPMFPALVAREGAQSETAQLYASVAGHLRAVQPDVLVIFDSDHLNTFFLDNFPTMSVGIAERTSGPNDGTPGLPHYDVQVCESMASHLFASAMGNGFDLARSQEFEIDHSILVPLHFLTPEMQIPIVPVFINGIVHPLPAARRCHALGQLVRQAVESLPDQTRVAVVGSGSFSLDVGGPLSPRGAYSGVPDPTWTRSILGHLHNGQLDDLLNAVTSDRLARAGNVAGELLNWIAMLGVVGSRKPVFLEPQMEHGHAYGVWRWD